MVQFQTPKMRRSNSQRNMSEEKSHLEDGYKKMVLDIWKEVKLQNKKDAANFKRGALEGETQTSV